MKTERMNLRKWYGTSVRIPDYSSYNFTTFVVSSFGIVKSVLKERLRQDITVRFTSNGTAYADMEHHVIGLNRSFVDGHFPGQEDQLPSDQTIAVILGIIVHEAAHFAYSPVKVLHDYADYVKAHTKRTYYEKLAASLGNVIEDIYIEAEIGRTIPSLSWMLDETNAVFFPEGQVEKMLNQTGHITSAPEQRADVILAQNILLYAKTRSFIATTPYLTDLFNLVRTATEMDTIAERTALCLEIYDALLEKIEHTEEDEDDNDDDDGEGESGESGEGEGSGGGGDKSMTEEEFEKALKDALEKSEAAGAKHDGEPSNKPVTAVVGSRAEQVADQIERMINNVIRIESDGESGEGMRIFIEKTPDLAQAMPMDERYVRLAEMGRQRASVNRPYGMDMNRGNHIRKLHRIATDGKIFAQPLTMNQYKPMQVVILVDCSGSMYTPMRLNGEVMYRITAAMKASIGAAHGLTEARCEVAVFGHTADIDGGGSVRIYRGKDFNEPVSLLSQRWQGLIESRQASNNRDGEAVRYVAGKLNSATRRKLLIVISDGMPSAGGYVGNAAVQHTKREVKKVRERGIEVMSISISEDARRACDEIYGNEWNVFNEDPNVLEMIVKSLLG